MTTTLTIAQAGPALTIQDRGRAGWLAQGLTKGGAADLVALYEGAALLGQSPDLAVIEMTGTGGTFTADADIRIALTGASMTANIDGEAIVWNAIHLLPAGAKLTIGGATSGTYGYLHIGGGIATDPALGARASHLSAGLGAALKAGDRFVIGTDKGRGTGMLLPRDTRFDGGVVRVVASMQTDRFMDHDGEGFYAEGGLTILSEVIVPGDIQITGDGAPFVLMGESQTTGGYPRIGTVIPRDLPRVAQAPAGTKITFEFVTLDQAITLETQHRRDIKALPGQITACQCRAAHCKIRSAIRSRQASAWHAVSGRRCAI